MQGQSNPHTRVKIALLASTAGAVRKPQSTTRSNCISDLGLDKDALVLVALRGQASGR